MDSDEPGRLRSLAVLSENLNVGLNHKNIANTKWTFAGNVTYSEDCMEFQIERNWDLDEIRIEP